MTKRQQEIVRAMIIGDSDVPTRPLNQEEIEALDAAIGFGKIQIKIPVEIEKIQLVE